MDDKPGNNERSELNDEPSKKRAAPWDDGRIDAKRSRQGMGTLDQEKSPYDARTLGYKVVAGSRALLRNQGGPISKYKFAFLGLFFASCS